MRGAITSHHKIFKILKIGVEITRGYNDSIKYDILIK